MPVPAWRRKQSRERNVRTMVDGILFDSKKEAYYYGQLVLMQKAGRVKFFLRQVPFRLSGGVKYVADFMVFYNDDTYEVIDVKGRRTAMYKTKKRLVEAAYPIKIREV